MITVIYGLCFILSLAFIVYMAAMNYDNVNIHQWSVVVLLPIINGAYFLITLVDSRDAIYALMCFVYIDSTALLTILIFTMLKIINVNVKPKYKIMAYVASFAHILMVMLNIHTKDYYIDIFNESSKYGKITKAVKGPLIKVHYAYIALVFVALIAILVAGYIRKGTYSLRNLSIMAFFVVGGIILYAVEVIDSAEYTCLPVLYTIAGGAIVANYNHSRGHEIFSLISQQQSVNSVKGYMALGLNHRFLGCNNKCKEFITDLKEQRIDDYLPENSRLREGIDRFIEVFEKGEKNSAKFNVGDRIWICDISHFSVRKDGKPEGYLFELRDATEEEKTYEIVSAYNETLNAEVTKKTAEVKAIQRKIVLGMADMIENRDTNTGGHVKRTSDVVQILINEINRSKAFNISLEDCKDIVRSAPMHDLGKISIDSSILCKNGKLTDEEFKIMQSHATKSGEIVKILLEGVEEQHFVDTCYDVARCHHEKWDGTGYPQGLKGEAIPIGARIMAVADVLDALMCKRAYKESMSFDEASNIMLDGMGKLFDPRMKKVFINCSDKLKEYYSNVQA